jgi:hypothetical protein
MKFAVQPIIVRVATQRTPQIKDIDDSISGLRVLKTSYFLTCFKP